MVAVQIEYSSGMNPTQLALRPALCLGLITESPERNNSPVTVSGPTRPSVSDEAIIHNANLTFQ